MVSTAKQRFQQLQVPWQSPDLYLHPTPRWPLITQNCPTVKFLTPISFFSDIYLHCQLSGTLIPPLIILWLLVLSLFLLNSPPPILYRPHGPLHRPPLHSSTLPTHLLGSHHLLPFQHSTWQSHTPQSVQLLISSISTPGLLEKTTQPYRMRPPEMQDLYPQMPGSISSSPASSYSSQCFPYPGVFKVCTLSLSGYVFFTFKIWPCSYFVRKMRQLGNNSHIWAYS